MTNIGDITVEYEVWDALCSGDSYDSQQLVPLDDNTSFYNVYFV